MNRAWGATGVGKYFPPRLSPAGRKRIEEELPNWDINLRDLEPLLNALAEAIGRYDSWREMRTASGPAAVRSNLKATLTAAEKLKERLHDLDGNSWLLIKEAANIDTSSLRDNLKSTIRHLSAALLLAEHYPNEGNLPENERLFLAADVLDGLKKHLRAKSWRGRNRGCFEAILIVVLEEAFGKRRKDIEWIASSLVDQVLSRKVRIEKPDGVVEYRRPQRRADNLIGRKKPQLGDS